MVPFTRCSVLMMVNTVSLPPSNSCFNDWELLEHWSLHQGWLHQFYTVYLGFGSKLMLQNQKTEQKKMFWGTNNCSFSVRIGLTVSTEAKRTTKIRLQQMTGCGGEPC